MIYPPNQKPPIWSIDPGVISYNCQKAGMPHPVLAMPMWEGAGNRVLDYSGHGNHGTIDGATWIADGIIFDGSDDWISIDPMGNMPTISLSTLIYPNSDGGLNEGRIAEILYRDRWYVNNESAGTVQLYGRGSTNDTSPISQTSTTIPINQRSHVIFAYDDISDRKIHIYINGQEASYTTQIAGTGTKYSNSFAFGIGKRTGYSSSWFDGGIDNPIIFNTALSASQAKLLYNDPYFMYQIPEELYGYVAAAAGISIPSLMQQMNQFDGGTYALC